MGKGKQTNDPVLKALMLVIGVLLAALLAWISYLTLSNVDTRLEWFDLDQQKYAQGHQLRHDLIDHRLKQLEKYHPPERP